MNGTTSQPTDVFDRLSSDGTILQRGYLELSLDEQHCEGASPAADDGSACLTLTLFVCDPKDNSYREATVFKTHVSGDTPVETRKKLLVRFMDRLVNKHGVSAFAAAGEVDKDALEGFRSEIEYATASWVE
jgi:hypothetical protein